MTDGVPITHPLRHPDRFFIDGEWAAPSSSDKTHVRDSASEEIFLSVAEARDSDVDRAVAAARNAFDYGPLAANEPPGTCRVDSVRCVTHR